MTQEPRTDDIPRHCAWCEPFVAGATSGICEECEEVMTTLDEGEDDDMNIVLNAVLAYANARLALERSHEPDAIRETAAATDRAYLRVIRLLRVALQNAKETHA